MGKFKEKIKKTLDLGDNPNSVHYAPIMDRNQNEAIMLLTEQIETLWAIVKAYKRGDL